MGSGLWKKEKVRKSRLDFGKRKKSEKVRLWKKEKVRKSPTLEKGKSPKKSDFGKTKMSQKVRFWKKRKSPKKFYGLWKRSEKVVWTLEKVRKSRLDFRES